MAKHRYKQTYRNGRVMDEHRAIMEDYLERHLETDEWVHHLNGDRFDNRIENLELTTCPNHARCHIKSSPIYGKGEKNHQAKLCQEDIGIIRLWISKGYAIYAIAKSFDVGHTTIRDIRDGKTWAWV